METELLRLDLQHFSQGEQTDPPANPEPTEPTEVPQAPNAPAGPNDTAGDPVNSPAPAFTQEDIDRIVKERLAREQKKREEAIEKEREEAERKRLEEEQKYKELYEAMKSDLEAQRTTALQAKKETLLVKAGYSDEQAVTLSKLLEGEDDSALSESLDGVKKLFPPTKEKGYGDPNPGNGGKQTPAPKNLKDKGKSQYERLKAIGKIKGRK